MKNHRINVFRLALSCGYYLRLQYLLLVSMLLLTTPVYACYDIPPPIVLDTPMMSYVYTANMLDSVVMGRHFKKNAGPKFSTIAQGKGNAEVTAHALAQRMPAAQRKEVEQAFIGSFVTYQKLEKQLGIPKNDMAGALSAYLVGNYEAFHNTTLPESHVKQLVGQMRGALASNPALKNATLSQKREFYEQMAIVGTFMVLAQAEIKNGKQPPNVKENFRNTAKANLEQFFKKSIDKIDIGASGLKIR
ncbi:MAG: DUF6683 family protein [Methylotenera sp.]